MDSSQNKVKRSRIPFSPIIGFLFIILTSLFLFSSYACKGKQGSRSAAVPDSIAHETELNLKIEELDPQLHENSGIIMYRGAFWTINDSGNDPILYAFHPPSIHDSRLTIHEISYLWV